MKKGLWKIFEFDEFDCLCSATANEDGEYRISFAISVWPGNSIDISIGGFSSAKDLMTVFDSLTKDKALPLIDRLVAIIKDGGVWNFNGEKD